MYFMRQGAQILFMYLSALIASRLNEKYTMPYRNVQPEFCTRSAQNSPEGPRRKNILGACAERAVHVDYFD
jgi:hypothetical protein